MSKGRQLGMTCGADVVYDSTQMGGGNCLCAPFPPSLVRVGSAEHTRWLELTAADAARKAAPLSEAQIERDVIDLFGPKEA